MLAVTLALSECSSDGQREAEKMRLATEFVYVRWKRFLGLAACERSFSSKHRRCVSGPHRPRAGGAPAPGHAPRPQRPGGPRGDLHVEGARHEQRRAQPRAAAEVLAVLLLPAVGQVLQPRPDGADDGSPRRPQPQGPQHPHGRRTQPPLPPLPCLQPCLDASVPLPALSTTVPRYHRCSSAILLPC